MKDIIPLAICLVAGLAALILLRHPLKAAGRLALRAAVGMGFLWLFNLVFSAAGMHVGINLFTGAAVGLLGMPGFAMLLLLQCI